jgi:hypothetical protein
MNRRKILQGLFAFSSVSFLKGFALQKPETRKNEPKSHSRSHRKDGLRPLRICVQGSFAIRINKKDIKLFTPAISDDDPPGIGHHYWIGTDAAHYFSMKDSEADYLYAKDSITPNATPPKFDPALNPVLTNIPDPDGKYRFSVTIPLPDSVDSTQLVINRGTNDFFVEPQPQRPKPTKLPMLYQFFYNTYDRSKLAFGKHALSVSEADPVIYIVSEPDNPAAVKIQCEDSRVHTVDHPQAAMKAIGDMLGEELFLNREYCGQTALYVARLKTLGIHLPPQDRTIFSRLPACMSLIVDNTSP